MYENEKLSSVLTYHLVQHTPMIHFQSNEIGACLRPSEIKPKLDKFLCKKLGDKLKKDFFISEEKLALNYKVKVTGIGEKGISKTINSMYFGNMGTDESDQKKSVFYKEGLCLEILCFNSELRKHIQDHIEEFFLTTNFGTRQSKGFGSFAVEGSEGKMLQYLDASKCHYFYTNTGFHNVADVQDAAAAIYAIMKGGINRSGKNEKAYIKGYIQRQYFKDLNQNTGSEKAKIKSSMLIIENEEENKYDDYSYSRAILGLADHYSFIAKKYDENAKNPRPGAFRKGEIEISSKEIDRFKSPLMIKIINSYIYFIFDDSYKEILNKSFQFSVKEKSNNSRTIIKNREETITVPKQFDPDHFIDGFMKYFKKENYKLECIGYPHKKALSLQLMKGGSAS
ncbi:MAG: hypothetical protein PUC12_00245 [Clostridiales bacterium]|nr:hypothetical protein [Clostridiales bacterium]